MGIFFLCVQGFILCRFITLRGYYVKSEALSGSQWKQPRTAAPFFRKHFIVLWQVLHYVALMTLSAFTRMMKEVKELYWERHTHTHTRRRI